MPVLNGKAYWASVVTPNTTFDEDGVYSIDLAVDEENKKSAVSEGLSIKNKGDERGDFVTIKRKAKRKDGSLKRPLQNTLIGNGSTVNVLFKTYEWNHKPTNRSGKSADLQAVQVVNLIPYEGSNSASSAFKEVPEGNVVTSTSTEFAEIPV
jgi:hypothetical protein